MRINDICESFLESVEDDVHYRNSAKVITEKLRREIHRVGLANHRKASYKGLSAYIVEVDDEVLGHTVRLIVLDGMHDDASAAFSPESTVLVFHDIENGLPILDNHTLWDNVYHELIHYYDYHRSRGRQASSSDALSKDGMKGYANNDAELNAYYHEMLDSTMKRVESFKRSGNYGKLYDMLLSDANKFVKLALGTLDGAFRDNMTEANLNRFRKRLVRHYRELDL